MCIRDINKTDLLIVAMHWGTEYKLTPDLYQKDMANYLASLGVDIVIGTHPHVIEPIEWIGDTLIIYSLGNFVSAHEVINMDNRVGLMTSLTVNKSANGKITIENVDNGEFQSKILGMYSVRGLYLPPVEGEEIYLKLSRNKVKML